MSSSLLGTAKKGVLLIVSAPAGTGKTTLVRMLTLEFSSVVESVSYTTRSPRPGEREGVDYYFISREEFEVRMHADEFFEHAEVFGQLYGTSRKAVEKLRGEGRHVVLVIDTQGALQLMDYPLEAAYIFISPPNLGELRERLVSRKSESKESLEKRLSWAEREIDLASHYDYHIVNDHLETAYQVLRSILIAETHRTPRSPRKSHPANH